MLTTYRRAWLSSHFRRLAPVAQRAPRLGRFRGYASSTLAETTKVERIILDNIKATGPITFSNYMQYCLAHPTEGYYMKATNPVFGARGDFITSPEISQVFGELLGVWLLSRWLEPAVSGARKKIRLVELGPGRGTLMADILRVFSQFPVAQTAIKEIHLVETSESLREVQKSKLSDVTYRLGGELVWKDMIEDIPEDPEVYTMLVAHEFFDALPFHLLEKSEKGWHEVLIASGEQKQSTSSPTNPSSLTSSALEDAENAASTTGPIPPPLSTALNLHASAPPVNSPLDIPSGPAHNPVTAATSDSSNTQRFRYVLAPEPTMSSTLLGLTSPRFQELPVGSRIEVSVTANKIARKMGALLSPTDKDGVQHDAGAALIVDYGDTKAFGDSFRAFKQHKIVDIFYRPGECDLTTNVDFAYLSEALAERAVPLGPLRQDEFLERMGLAMRVQSLIRATQDETRVGEIESAAKRLTDGTGMGGQYKVLGVVGNGAGKSRDGDSGEVWPFLKLEADTLASPQ